MDLTISHKPLNREEIYAMFPPLKKMLVTLDYCLWFVVISCLAVVIADILYHRRGVPCFLIFWLLIFWLPFFLFAGNFFPERRCFRQNIRFISERRLFPLICPITGSPAITAKFPEYI